MKRSLRARVQGLTLMQDFQRRLAELENEVRRTRSIAESVVNARDALLAAARSLVQIHHWGDLMTMPPPRWDGKPKRKPKRSQKRSRR